MNFSPLYFLYTAVREAVGALRMSSAMSRRALEDVSLGQTRVRLHDMVPRPGMERSHRDVHPSCGQLATRILEHVVRRSAHSMAYEAYN